MFLISTSTIERSFTAVNISIHFDTNILLSKWLICNSVVIRGSHVLLFKVWWYKYKSDGSLQVMYFLQVLTKIDINL
jgi:hypothetical protein